MIRVILFTVVTLFIVGCGNDATQNTKAEVKSKQEVKEEVKVTVQDVQTAVQEVKDVTKEIKESAVQEAKTVVKDTKVVIQEVVNTVIAVDATSIYKVCAGCHGVDGSKSALNKSQIIKGWDAKKIADALHGYKNGTYGGAMKGLMSAQVSKLGDAEIEALSTYISKF